ncbi:MAG: imidazole glycerol phosphate synthase subunit HisF [Acidimicrobiia bacterium]
MLAARVIPCLDIKDGRVVKGVRFQELRDAGDPVENAAAYEEQGADEIILLDVSATPEDRGNAVETVRAVRSVLSIPLTVGGGVRRESDAGRLLDAGADKVGVNTAAVSRPDLVAEIASRFGSQCTVLAVDAAFRATPPVIGTYRGHIRTPVSQLRGGWEVVVQSGANRTGLDVVEWCRKATALGAGEILLTSWDRDGTRDGYDVDLIAAVSGAVTVPVIASGGAARPEHLIAALRAGASAALVASILHDGDTTVADLKLALSRAGITVRR